MDEIQIKLLSLVITIISILITYYLVPYLKKKLGKEKFNEIYDWVSIAVNAAEQIFNEPGMGEKKKHYVLKFLQDRGIELSYQELDALIEAVVYEINRNKLTIIEQGVIEEEIAEEEEEP